MSEPSYSLPKLGWSHFYQQQLSLDEWEATFPARVLAVHRKAIDVASAQGRQQIDLSNNWLSREALELPTVGDWLLIDSETGQPHKLLERKSLFSRRSAGIEAKLQLIAANVDSLFLVSSCNQDFNLSRLERYLALTLDAGVEPVLVLTKADLAEDVAAYLEQARSLKADLVIETVNALDPASVEALRPWCGSGQTVALLGSSGVGKSTLINSLNGSNDQATAAIREDDARGRHTTTARSLHFLPQGGLLIDTPGMRELQLSDCADGVGELFEDIEQLAQACRFSDCQHQEDVGCAVKAAVEQGDLSPRRLANYLKLQAEQQRNAETIAERRRRDKSFGKMVKNVMAVKNRTRDNFR